MGRDLKTLLDLTSQEMEMLFNRAALLKKEERKGRSLTLAGKTAGLIFDKPSTRTRISFETALIHLGGTPIFISAKDSQISRNEPVRDTARVLSRYLDALVIRTYSQDLLEEFAEFSSIPVINALTDMYHPCQVLSDIMTILEYKGDLSGIRIAWVGDGNNVANSWINAAMVLGFDLVLACPEGYLPDPFIMERIESGGFKNILVVTDPKDAVSGADVVYTDVWVSMGQDSEQSIRASVRREAFEPFQVNADLISLAKEDVIVMHCLPAHRGEEITEDVLEGTASVVWDQAENKMHMHKAILEFLILEDR